MDTTGATGSAVNGSILHEAGGELGAGSNKQDVGSEATYTIGTTAGSSGLHKDLQDAKTPRTQRQTSSKNLDIKSPLVLILTTCLSNGILFISILCLSATVAITVVIGRRVHATA